MSEADQFLTPEVILLILLLLVTLGMWLQLALLRTRLSARLTRLEERFHEHDQLLELLAKGGPTAGSCLLYTSPRPRDRTRSRMPSSA